MANITDNDPRDALLLLSTTKAGKKEIDEFLREGNVPVNKRCLVRIMKQIRHSENYIDGHLTPRAKATAILLLCSLALFFVLLGIFSAMLTYEIFSEAEKNNRVEVAPEANKAAVVREITEFSKPYISGAEEKVLIKSSTLYNIQYTTDEGIFYYSQKPLYNAEESKDAEIESLKAEMAKKADICVVIGANIGYITVTDSDESGIGGSGKTTELYFEDEKYAYTVLGAQAIEQAVKIANSIKAEKEAHNKVS